MFPTLYFTSLRITIFQNLWMLSSEQTDSSSPTFPSYPYLFILYPVTSCCQSYKPDSLRHTWNYLNMNKKLGWGKCSWEPMPWMVYFRTLTTGQKESFLLTKNIWFTSKIVFCDHRKKEFLLCIPITICQALPGNFMYIILFNPHIESMSDFNPPFGNGFREVTRPRWWSSLMRS